MNVGQLIEELEKIENKNKIVVFTNELTLPISGPIVEGYYIDFDGEGEFLETRKEAEETAEGKEIVEAIYIQ